MILPPIENIQWQATAQTPSFADAEQDITDQIGTTPDGKIRVVRIPQTLQARLPLDRTPVLTTLLESLEREMGVERFYPHPTLSDANTLAYLIPVEATSIRHVGFQNLGYAPIHPLHVYAQRCGLGDRQTHAAEFAVLDARLGLNNFTSKLLCILLA